jgi:uncharacterized protein (TIGR03435 family)
MRLTALLSVACLRVFAQDSFEVASVKISKTPVSVVGARGGPGTDDPGIYTCENCSLIWLMNTAYDFEAYRIIYPEWMVNTAFVVNARVAPGATKVQFRGMLQNLLAERFKLIVHRDTREMPAFDLRVAKGGPKLKKGESDTGTDSAPASAEQWKLGADGYPRLSKGSATTMAMTNGRARLRYPMQTMDQLAGFLGAQLGGPVINQTGLAGEYKVELFWSTESLDARGTASEPRPDLIQAVQQQLGLQLVKKREPLEVIVVDRCDRVPTEN